MKYSSTPYGIMGVGGTINTGLVGTGQGFACPAILNYNGQWYPIPDKFSHIAPKDLTKAFAIYYENEMQRSLTLAEYLTQVFLTNTP